jgi:hypothetical protein
MTAANEKDRKNDYWTAGRRRDRLFSAIVSSKERVRTAKRNK